MNKIWLIIQREYITRVRKKSFILLTVLAPLGLGLIMLLPIFLMNFSEENQKVLIVEESNHFQAFPDGNGIYLTMEAKGIPLETALKSYEERGYDALLHIPDISLESPNGIKIYSTRQISLTTKLYLEEMIVDKIEDIQLASLSLTRSDIKRLRPSVSIEDAVTSDTGEKQGNAIVATAAGYIMGFGIYMVLLIYGSMVMKGVMEEKSTRIVEVMVSSVKPFQLMLGKIIGIGGVGLTQFGIWLVLGLIMQFGIGMIFADKFMAMQEMAAMPQADGNGEMLEIVKAIESLKGLDFSRLIFGFFFYFLGGYLLYAALFAAVGSLVNDDGGDAQLYTFPVTMPIIISIFIMMSVIQQPDSQLAVWASIIPFSSPIVMPARIMFNPPLIEIVLSMAFLVIGFIGTTWFAARIYRTAILMYGKKIRPKEVLRWLIYQS